MDGVDLVVPEGTVLGLLGPNGAGKTTTVRILTTLLRPDGGSARVAGFDVVTQSQDVRRSIGLSGQYAAVDENLTGWENLYMFGRSVRAAQGAGQDPGGRAAGPVRPRPTPPGRTIKTYSGGMRRRLDLAAALIGRPNLLFLDEPTTGLDPRSRLAMWDVIRSLVAEGTTLLLTTQYLEEADELADIIAVVDTGRIIAKGTADELKAQVGGERIELVVRDRGEMERARGLLGEMTSDVTLEEHTRRLTAGSSGGAQQLVEVVRRFGEEGIAVDDIALRRPTLDDVFLTLTGHHTVEESVEESA
ncbi:MAG: ATP-binding cassette domain-containing protein [Candidatus Nanopelagicales bacterium]